MINTKVTFHCPHLGATNKSIGIQYILFVWGRKTVLNQKYTRFCLGSHTKDSAKSHEPICDLSQNLSFFKKVKTCVISHEDKCFKKISSKNISFHSKDYLQVSFHMKGSYVAIFSNFCFTEVTFKNKFQHLVKLRYRCLVWELCV